VIVLGIDVGLSGALAVLSDDAPPEVYDLPTIKARSGNRRELSIHQLAPIVFGYKAIDEVRAIVEAQQAMPKQGVSSTFQIGEGYGAIKAMLATLHIPYEVVRPVDWKRWAGLIGKDKDASRAVAMQRFPTLTDQLKLKKHHGRADALLLAEWGRIGRSGQF